MESVALLPKQLENQKLEDTGFALFQKKQKRGKSARSRRRALEKLTRQKEALSEALEVVQDDKRHAELMKRMELLDKEIERNE